MQTILALLEKLPISPWFCQEQGTREARTHAHLVVVGTLKRAGGGERPARAALALVLHTSHGAGLDPIHGGGEGGHVSGGSVHLGGLGLGVLADAQVNRLAPLVDGL